MCMYAYVCVQGLESLAFRCNSMVWTHSRLSRAYTRFHSTSSLLHQIYSLFLRFIINWQTVHFFPTNQFANQSLDYFFFFYHKYNLIKNSNISKYSANKRNHWILFGLQHIFERKKKKKLRKIRIINSTNEVSILKINKKSDRSFGNKMTKKKKWNKFKERCLTLNILMFKMALNISYLVLP